MGETADSLLDTAHQAARVGRWRDALQLFRKAAAATTPRARDRARAADARRWCSIAAMRLGEWSAAAADARHSLVLSTRLADPQREAKSLNVAGAVEFERGDWVVALDLFERARLLATSVGDRLLLARIDNNEGALWAARGVPQRARRLYATALQGFRASRDPAASARVMNNLGLSLADEGFHAEAIEWYEQAASAAREIEDRDLLVTVLANLAGAAAETGRSAYGRHMLEEARALAERMEIGASRSDLCCALAKIARVEGRWEEAETWITTALRIAAEGPHPLAEAEALEEAAALRLAQDRIDDAIETIERARSRYRILGAKAAAARASAFASRLRGKTLPVEAPRADCPSEPHLRATGS